MSDITYKPIGVIRSSFTEVEGTPIQPWAAKGSAGTVELAPDLVEGLKDLDGFTHIVLIYHFHLSSGFSLTVTPFLDDQPRGVFATRAPKRPNAIGLSVVRLVGIEGATLFVEDLDVLDGTPLLDIKPFVPQFDNREGGSIGWLARRVDEAARMKADRRFAESSG